MTHDSSIVIVPSISTDTSTYVQVLHHYRSCTILTRYRHLCHCETMNITYLLDYKSFKSLLQNTIGRNTSQYTGNKQTYIHSLYINTKTYQQINYMYVQKESVRGILIKIKISFLISKDFIMNMDKFLISILFSVFISSINFGIFNLFQ